MKTPLTLTITDAAEGERIDNTLTNSVPGHTRSSIKNLINGGLVTVNGVKTKPGYRTRAEDVIAVYLPEPPSTEVRPEAIPLEIIYEDDDIIVINKPAGLTVHPGAGRYCGTLANALLAHAGALSTIGGADRPGIVHRLDKDTTGVIVAAKNDAAHLDLVRQFKEHSINRRYIAIVWGSPEHDTGVIDIAIGRDTKHRQKISTRTNKERRAVTRYKVLKRYTQMSLVELTPETGRTHQLRVHLAAINHPVVADPAYGRKRVPANIPKEISDGLKRIKRQCLHAAALGIAHPVTLKRLEFTSKLPDDMAELVRILEECI